MKKLFVGAVMLASMVSGAAEIGGKKIDDTAKVGGADLVLNGGGIRTKFGVAKVYVGALYVAQKVNDANAILGAATPRRMQLTMLRNVEADKLHSSFIEGLEENATEAEMAKFKSRIQEMNAIFLAVKEVKEGDVIALDFIPGKGTQISVRGQVKDVIAGDDFASALLRIWLGKNPVSGDLKKGLLGGR